jgi:ubiquinone biosynthesis monooxygenase Coq6
MVWSTRPNLAAALKRLSPEALVEMVNAGFRLPENHLEILHRHLLEADSAGTPLSTNSIQTLISQFPSETISTSTSSEPSILPSTVTSIPPKSIASFPLRLSHADSYLGTRTVLVGDAAHTIHPLAGQGLNMGLADVQTLANVWDKARRGGGDLGGHTELLAYPRDRYPKNHLMLSTTDKLHHVFGNRSAPVNWARGLGLDVINELGPLKRILMGGAGAGPGGASGMADQAQAGGSSSVPRGDGWSKTAADALEGWLGVKQMGGLVGAVVREGATNALRRVADTLDRRT